jgi:TRAP-type C4-dicarboxylate transport system substrate-binding protein
MKKNGNGEKQKTGRSGIMKKIRQFIVFIILVCVLNPGAVFAQRRRIVIKVASPVPEVTDWGKALNQISREWATITNGEVEFRVYHDGSQGKGNEQEMLTMLRAPRPSIQAAVFSSSGLNLISPGIMTLSAPFFIRDNNELDAVLTGLRGELESLVEKEGFVVLGWSRAGWVKIFSRSPVFVPNDLKRQKLGVNPLDDKMTHAFSTMGYQTIPVGLNDMLVSLSAGKIDAVYNSPIGAGGYQLFGVAENMTSINVAPFLGGLILTQQAWQSVPDQYKPRLLEVTARIVRNLDRSVTQLEDDVINVMKQNGLVVHQVSPEQAQVWYDDTARALPSLMETIFDRNLYQRIETILRDYRNRR